MQEPNNENTKPIKPQERSEQGGGETVPTRAQREPVDLEAIELTQPKSYPAPETAPAPKVRKPRRWPYVLLGILMLILLTGAGGWLGYRAAIQQRKAAMEEARVSTATDHFMLGLVAQGNKQYEVARQQFEYVIKLDPSFPGAQDRLREVMIAMAVVNTPTTAPTVAEPTLTPTVDMRPQEEIFNQARQQYGSKDWAGLFSSIDSLRRIDPTFRAVEIDGMLYMALRFRGIDKIILEANLEGGLYDLALAEQFGPLDVDARGYRNWSRLYLNGASFWEADWQKVMEYYEQIYPHFPNMRDSSGMTAIERYRIAAKSYADQLFAAGDACGAYEYYQKSLNAVGDGVLEQTATAVYLICYPPTPTATVTPEVTATVEVPPVVETTEAPPPPAETTEAPPPDETPETETTPESSGGMILPASASTPVPPQR